MTACPREEDLVALATGDGDAATRRHLAACPACAAQLAALEDDLSLLRGALRDAPQPVAARRAVWLPIGAASAAAAALLLVLAPWRASTPTEVAGESGTAEFATTLNAALFAAADTDTEADSDAAVLVAALNGGGLCGSGYAGGDCEDGALLAIDY